MDRAGLRLGIVAGLAAISCCVGPTVLALLGLSSVSLAISLGNTLYYQYGWYFRAAALVLAAAGVVGLLRGRRSCTLRGARQQWRLLLTVVVTMAIVYTGLYLVTTWLARAAS
jgi:NADH:ubiquinone oxidoreductase subunit 6 (subunit J)